MDVYLENTKRNILPKSESNDFEEALREWHFTGEVLVNSSNNNICEICEKKHLMHQYKIRNHVTDFYFWIGSHCILKFPGIVVRDDEGGELSEKQDRNRILKSKLRDSVNYQKMEPIRVLSRVREGRDERAIFEVFQRETKSWISFFKERNGFSPAHLAEMFHQFDFYGVDYIPSNFPMFLRGKVAENEFSKLRLADLQIIINAVPIKQIQKFRELLLYADKVSYIERDVVLARLSDIERQ